MTGKRIIPIAATITVCLLFVVSMLLERPHHPVAEGGESLDKNAPVIQSVTKNGDKIGRYEKLELSVSMKADYQNPYDPEEVDLHTVFTSPSGRVWKANGFYDGSAWKVRFAPSEQGKWSYRVTVKDRNGTVQSAASDFECEASTEHGWVHISLTNGRYFAYDDGSSFYGTAVAYPWNVTETGLDRIKANGGNIITYWNGNYDNAGNGGGVGQLMSPDIGLGRIDIAKSKRIDELVDWLAERNMHMSFVVWPHDSLAQKLDGWPQAWNRNAFKALGDAVQFYEDEENWPDQVKLYRYIIARWGYSSSIAIWDLICEINGTDGWAKGDRSKANIWAKRVHNYFAQNDPYRRPTSGSMGGGASDYWAEGYATFDISDRENYYDLTYAAYAADIRKRWDSFAKPLLIGETGNITDEEAYHNAIWSSLSNGLAMSPVWWAYDKMDDRMFAQMKSFSQFVSQIDFAGSRFEPTEAKAELIRVEKPMLAKLEAFPDIVDWAEEDWADASKDTGGLLKPRFEVLGDRKTIDIPFSLKAGGYTQGFAGQSLKEQTDWSSYDRLKVDLFLEGKAGKEPVMVKAVLFPQGNWNEADDARSVALKPGEWVSLEVPLRDSPAGYWRNAPVSEADLKKVPKWGIKIYTKSLDKELPVKVSVAEPTLLAGKAPIETKPAADGYIMRGARQSFGWMIAPIDRRAAGKTIEAAGFGSGSYTIRWFDPWSGSAIQETHAISTNGKLTITAPASNRTDVAFQIISVP